MVCSEYSRERNFSYYTIKESLTDGITKFLVMSYEMVILKDILPKNLYFHVFSWYEYILSTHIQYACSICLQIIYETEIYQNFTLKQNSTYCEIE